MLPETPPGDAGLSFGVSVVKKITLLLMTMALAVAMVACKGAAGVDGKDASTPPPVKIPVGPVSVGTIPDLSLMVEGTNMVDLNDAFNEPQSEALTFTATSDKPAIATATVDKATGILTVTAVAVGPAKVTVIAKDPGGLQAKQTFDVMVTAKVTEPEPDPDPDPPVTIDEVKTKYTTLEINPATSSMMEIELPADHTLRSAKTTVVTVAPKGATTGAAASSIRWASATAADMAKNMWVITAVTPGEANVEVLDGDGTKAHTIVVTVVDRPPTVAKVIDNMMIAVMVSEEIELAGYFSDPDMQTLTFEADSSDPSKATVTEGSGGTITITGKEVGSTTITVTATDGTTPVEQAFMVTVKANQSPTVPTRIGAQSVTIGTPLEIMLADHFSDPEGQTLTYKATSDAPSNAMVTDDDVTLTVTGVEVGSAVITVTAMDVAGNSVDDQFSITVAAAATTDDSEPDSMMVTIKGKGKTEDYTAEPGQDLVPQNTLYVTAMRKPNSATDWILTGEKRGMTKIDVVNDDDTSGGTISVTVINSAPMLDAEKVKMVADIYTLARDTKDNTPDTPLDDFYKVVIAGTSDASVTTQLTEEAVFSLDGFFTDTDAPDGDKLTYSVVSSTPRVVKATMDGLIIKVFVIKKEGRHFTLTVRAEDDKMTSADDVLMIDVYTKDIISKTYPVKQDADGRLLKISVENRQSAAVSHMLTVEDFGSEMGLIFAQLHATKYAANVGGNTPEPNGTGVGFSKPNDTPALGDEYYEVDSSGAVRLSYATGATAPAAGALRSAGGTKPTLSFTLNGTERSTIMVKYHLYVDKDGAVGDGEEDDQDWMTASETLTITVNK